MKKLIVRFTPLTTLTTLLALALAMSMPSASAQSTNVMQKANFVLIGTTQTPTGDKSVRVVNKDILAALNATGAYNFGPKAALFFVSTDDQPPGLVVREVIGGQTTTTDVSPYFGAEEIGNEVDSGKAKTRWETWHVVFDNKNTNSESAFELWGLTTIHLGAIHTPHIGTLAGPQRFQANVKGVGLWQGATTIFSGSISAGSPSLIIE
jgi:hypothetical protein